MVVVRLQGHLTEAELRSALATATAGAVAPFPVLVDCIEMTSYELAARHAFVEWNRANKERVTSVAVVTDRSMWKIVVSAMVIASGQSMRAFDSHDRASAWLAGARD